ncbi:MAG TPA: helix-turn-helix domain-containing protein [Nakamurella multipartita]|nr:helix-turn-helix domain-containing protein [Nakamurella multipartita]
MPTLTQARTFEVAARIDECVVDAWEHHNAVTLVELACRVPANLPFRAREVNLQLDRLHLARVQGTPHGVARDHTLVSNRPLDAIVVYAALRGEALWKQAGSSRVVRPGQLVVCDVDRPFNRTFGHGLEELVVKVQRDAFIELTGRSTIEAPIFLDAAGSGANPYARALVRLVGRAVDHCQVPADERTILELVSVLATGGRVGLPVAHRAAARAFIDDHLTDPSLSAAEVARGTGISERHLSRLFAQTGTSIPQHVLARRLDLAHSWLTGDRAAELRIADIAARCGFTSTAYFSEAFKRRFGATAGEVRRTATPTGTDQRA